MMKPIKIPTNIFNNLKQNKDFCTSLINTLSSLFEKHTPYIMNDNEKILFLKDNIILTSYEDLSYKNFNYVIHKEDNFITLYNNYDNEDMNSFLDNLHYGFPSSLFCGVTNPLEIKTLSNDMVNLKKFLNTLDPNNSLGFPTEENFISIIEEHLHNDAKFINEHIEQFIFHLNYMKKCSTSFSIDHKFSFFDNQNSFYSYQNSFILVNQDNYYIITSHDEKNHNFSIYSINDDSFFAKDMEIEEVVFNKIQDKSFDKFYDLVWEVKDKKTTYYQPSKIDNFISNNYITIKELTRDTNIDIFPNNFYSFEYQSNYYYHKHKLLPIDFSLYAFLTLGNGFSYDKDKGVIYSDIPYVDNLDEAPKLQKFNPSINEKLSIQFFVFYSNFLNEIEYLNPTWLESLIEVNKILKYSIRYNKRIEPEFETEILKCIDKSDEIINNNLNNIYQKNKTSNLLKP